MTTRRRGGGICFKGSMGTLSSIGDHSGLNFFAKSDTVSERACAVSFWPDWPLSAAASAAFVPPVSIVPRRPVGALYGEA